MANLRDYFESDINTMINTNEFGDFHLVNGVQMAIILDEDLLKERQRKSNDPDGVYVGDILFHVSKPVFGERPVPDQIVKLDGESYRVADVQEDEGLYSITLVGNMS